jgi:hypothetical protein
MTGWTLAREADGVQYLRRPNKKTGWSATVGYCTSKHGWPLLAVFSSNADPFPGPSADSTASFHSRFDVYARINHKGDYSAAARDLARQGYGDQGKRKKTKQSDAPPPGGDPPEDDRQPPARATGYTIILAHFRTKYQPTFRRGTNLYSAALGREVKVGEACCGAGQELIRQLAQAVDAPKNNDGVKHSALPQFFRTWSSSAWVDLLDSLPEEEAAGEIAEPAKEEFRVRLKAALNTIVCVGKTVYRRGREDQQDKEDTEVQRRSLIDWCVIFAKPTKRWESVRSYNVWSRREPTECGDRVRVALRVELFGQLGFHDLARLSPKKFTQLAEQYEVGTRLRVDRENRGVELAEGFVEELLDRPSDE